jgi:hypothetical protein
VTDHAAAGLRVVHALPRRVRVKVNALKGNPPAAQEVEERLWSIPGVCRAEASPATGSVLVVYDERTTWRDSIPALARDLATVAPDLDAVTVAARLAAGPETLDAGPILEARDVTGFFGRVNDVVRTTVAGLDLSLLVPLVLVLFGMRGLLVAEEATVPRWYDLLWFGFGTFMMLNAAGVPTARAAERAAEVAAAV